MLVHRAYSAVFMASEGTVSTYLWIENLEAKTKWTSEIGYTVRTFSNFRFVGDNLRSTYPVNLSNDFVRATFCLC